MDLTSDQTLEATSVNMDELMEQENAYYANENNQIIQNDEGMTVNDAHLNNGFDALSASLTGTTEVVNNFFYDMDGKPLASNEIANAKNIISLGYGHESDKAADQILEFQSVNMDEVME
jgi:hypothetical protein